MPDVDTPVRPKSKTRTERPKLYKVILLNDDYTPRDFVVTVLKAVFRMNEGEALAVMMAAHQQDVAVVAVFTKEIAEEKARQASDMAASEGFPLAFTTEREE